MQGERLKAVRKFLKLSQADMAKKLKVSQKTIANYENSKELPEKVLSYLQLTFDIREEYIRSGAGSMIIPPEEYRLHHDVYKNLDKTHGLPDNNENNCEIISIPILDVRASAGYGRENFDIEPIGFFKITRKAFDSIDTERIKNIQVAGDSMTPTLEDGDWVTLIEGMIAGNGIYVLNVSGELFVKRINFKLNNDIEVISDNPKYGTEKLRKDETIIVGKCVLRLGKLV